MFSAARVGGRPTPPTEPTLNFFSIIFEGDGGGGTREPVFRRWPHLARPLPPPPPPMAPCNDKLVRGEIEGGGGETSSFPSFLPV
jgi:hypothetical protein